MRKTSANWMTRAALAAAIALGAIGCARDVVPNQSPTAEIQTQPIGDAHSTTSVPAKPTPQASARHSRLPQDAKPSKATVGEKFAGPFPHRTNPFALPNATSAVTAAKQRATVKQADERLLGFVDVDGRKVLLQIDGKLWAARPGDSRNGIEVVEIAPAQVTLRRDGATWQLTLLTHDRRG